MDLYVLGIDVGLDLQFQVAAGSVTEPASAPSVFAAGAVCWAAVTAEPFSSQGPTIDGRIKPDIAGPDNVSSFMYGNFTSCTGASGFAGTSAASPHVAGAAALVLGANPTYTPAQIKAHLQTNSTDLGPAGADKAYGSGLVMLPTKPSPPANVAGFPFDSSVQVLWSAPRASDRPIQLYTVTSDPASAGCTATVTTCTDTGLTNGTPYTFQVTATNVLGTSDPSVASDPVTRAAPIPATYHAVTPARVLDTRSGIGLSGAFNSHVARSSQVTGNGGVPNGATAVTGNLTVTQQTSVGFLFIGPVGMNDPTSSNLNFPVGDDRANAVTVALSKLGKLSVTFAGPTYGPTAHVIFDVTGYFMPDDTGVTDHALTPARILDTRSGNGLTGPFSSHVARTFAVWGRGGVPTNTTAVTGNVTITQQTMLGFLYIGPVAVNNPTSSNLNFPVGDDRANAVTVALSTSGTLSVTYAAPAYGPTAM
jgi:hypothetical protein